MREPCILSSYMLCCTEGQEALSYVAQLDLLDVKLGAAQKRLLRCSIYQDAKETYLHHVCASEDVFEGIVCVQPARCNTTCPMLMLTCTVVVTLAMIHWPEYSVYQS